MPKHLIQKVHFKQELATSCVPAAARIVLNFLGVTVESEAYLRRILKTKSVGTNIFNLAYLKDEREWNVDVWSELGSLKRLEDYLIRYNIPVIAQIATDPLNYLTIPSAHALVVVGFDDEHIIVNDPLVDDQELPVPKDEFLQAWSIFQNLMIVIRLKG